MLDSKIRPLIDPPLEKLATLIAQAGISANAVTLSGFAIGLGAFPLLAYGHYQAALFLIILNRLADGLDGAVARQHGLNKNGVGASDYGAFLDIVTDFIIYAGTVFFLAVSMPDKAIYAAFVIFSFIGSGVSFLAYAIIAAKRGMEKSDQGRKSFYYMDGLMEGTETIVFMVLLCLLPEYFGVLCATFGILCWLTATGRIYRAYREFN